MERVGEPCRRVGVSVERHDARYPTVNGLSCQASDTRKLYYRCVSWYNPSNSTRLSYGWYNAGSRRDTLSCTTKLRDVVLAHVARSSWRGPGRRVKTMSQKSWPRRLHYSHKRVDSYPSQQRTAGHTVRRSGLALGKSSPVHRDLYRHPLDPQYPAVDSVSTRGTLLDNSPLSTRAPLPCAPPRPVVALPRA